MKKIFAVLLMVLSAALIAADNESPQQKYINKYSAMAIREMQRSGVPASITLAQGMLESRNGLSELAAKGNNHFGIKCHDWKGKSMRVDDDKKGECFRVYNSAEESFRDHSDFLRFRDRYKFLFDYELTDYKSWAYGLSKAGYATDPSYPQKLIKLIEDYDLSQYDVLKPEQKREVPEPPAKIEEVVRVEGKNREVFNFPLSRPIYSQNGVAFVYAQEGETYKSLAQSNNLFYREILLFNDLSHDPGLRPGDVVYLQKKKKYSKKGLDKYVVEEDGENLRDICQRFAVRRKNIEKLNGYQKNHVLREGDMILLRK